ncbi:hypothetical protein DFP72DRAFT_909354, partial [Ephemerocybe angulata]
MVRSVVIAAPLKTMTSKPSKDQGTDERFILVLGQSGAGKSSFINAVSNSTLRIGNGLASSTEKVEISLPFFIDGQCFRLVDAPGYDEAPEKSDTDVLNTIASFLASEYTNGRSLAGAIYIHSIASSRVGGTGRRNLNMFQKLCGRRALRNVAVVTTRWDEVKTSTAMARETDMRMKSTLFKHLFDNEATLFRYDRKLGVVPAQTIIRHFITTTPMPLLVQREMVDEGKLVSETTAGIELQKDFRKRMEESHQTMRQLKEEFHELKGDNDIAAARDVRKEMISVKERFDKIREDCRKLTAIKTAPQAMRILISPTAAAPAASTSAAAGGPAFSIHSHAQQPGSRARSRVNSLSSIPALPPQPSSTGQVPTQTPRSRSHSRTRQNSFSSIPALPPAPAPIITSTPRNKGKSREITPDPQPQVTFTRPRQPSITRRTRRDSGGLQRHREPDNTHTQSRAVHTSSRRDRRRPKDGQEPWDELRFFLFVGLLLLIIVPIVQRSRAV